MCCVMLCWVDERENPEPNQTQSGGHLTSSTAEDVRGAGKGGEGRLRSAALRGMYPRFVVDDAKIEEWTGDEAVRWGHESTS